MNASLPATVTRTGTSIPPYEEPSVDELPPYHRREDDASRLDSVSSTTPSRPSWLHAAGGRNMGMANSGKP